MLYSHFCYFYRLSLLYIQTISNLNVRLLAQIIPSTSAHENSISLPILRLHFLNTPLHLLASVFLQDTYAVQKRSNCEHTQQNNWVRDPVQAVTARGALRGGQSGLS